MRNLIAAFGIVLLASCLPWEDDGVYACDVDTGADCETCDAATGWCRDITAIAGGTDKLSAISGVSSSAVWAVGSNGVIIRWNGTRWSVESSGTSYGFNAVWAKGPNDVFAVGQGGVWSHYNGGAWTTKYETRSWIWPPASGTTVQVGNFTAVGGNPSWWTWALDDQGMVSFHDAAEDDFDFYGATATPTTFWGAWGDNAGNSYFLGTEGTCIKDPEGNGTWIAGTPPDVGVQILTSGTARTITAVWGDPNGADFWAVGSLGTVIRYQGGAFSSVSAGTTIDLWGVCGTSDSDVFIAGEQGVVRHWDGAVWTAVPQPYAEAIFSIYCTAGDLFAVTSEGAIIRKKR